jgi:hypothetical protein
MAAPERQQQLLAVLVVVLAAILGYRLWARPSAGTAPASYGRAPARAGTRDAPARPQAPEVRLRQLEAAPPQPNGSGRNLFRFQPKTAPPPAATTGPTPGGAQPAPAMPAGPSTTPINLKFIGIVEAPEQDKKFAVLSDGRNVYQGKEGDIIEGRFKILHIGAESIELAYIDGRGRQTIRLTGS